MMYIKELVAAFAPHRGKALVVSGRPRRKILDRVQRNGF
jgi:hypothetical protein